jgi:hypothetical protein
VSTNTPTLASVIRDAIEAALFDVHTCIPGKIVTYDKVNQTATVQPLIKSAFINESGVRESVKIPAIPGVSVMLLGNSAFSISWPVQKGDTGLIMFSEASLDKWKVRGGEVDPDDDRRFNLSDAMFIPALRPWNGPIPPDGISDTAMIIRGPEIQAGGNEELAFKSDVQAIKDAISDAAVSAGDGGATFKTNILAGLLGIPVGTSVLKGG